MDAERDELRAERERLADVADQLSRDRAEVSVRAAEMEGKLASLKKDLDIERKAVEALRAQAAEEQEALATRFRDLQDERNAFARRVEALTNLGLEVQRESLRVSAVHDDASSRLTLAVEKEEASAMALRAAEQERARADEAVHSLERRRQGFEQERLSAARERHALLADRLQVGRTAEATRELQLQLVRRIAEEAGVGEDLGSSAAGQAVASGPAAVPERARDVRGLAAADGAARDGAKARATAQRAGALDSLLLREEREAALAELSSQSDFIAQLRSRRPRLATGTAPWLEVDDGRPPDTDWAPPGPRAGSGSGSSVLASAFPAMVTVDTPSAAGTGPSTRGSSLLPAGAQPPGDGASGQEEDGGR